MSRTFSLKDVAEHGTKEAPWIIIHDKVYNVAEFLDKVSFHVLPTFIYCYIVFCISVIAIWFCFLKYFYEELC